MVVKGRVVDGSTQQPLAGASITLVDANGKYLGVGIATDNQGVFSLDVSIKANEMILATFVGYEPLLIDPYLLTSQGLQVIPLKVKTLEDIVFTFTRKKGLALLLMLALLGTGGEIMKARMKKKKKVVSKPSMIAFIKSFKNGKS